MTIACTMLVAAAVATASPDVPRHDAPALSPRVISMAAAIRVPGGALEAQGIGTEPGARALERWTVDRPARRPAALPAMYATLGVLQALDVYSTRRALGAGAHEANPLMKSAAGSSAAMLAVKALSSAGTIYFAERAWKKNRKGAVVLMAAINGVSAAIAARNFSNAAR